MDGSITEEIQMRLEAANLYESRVTDVDNMLNILQAIKTFQEGTPFNNCIIMDMNDDSIKDHGRIDLELFFQNIDYDNNVVKSQLWQKVFYINGEILDCNTYRHRYLEVKS